MAKGFNKSKMKYLDGTDVSPLQPVISIKKGKHFVIGSDAILTRVITANAYRMRKLVLENGTPAPNPETVHCFRKNQIKYRYVTADNGQKIRAYSYRQYLFLKKRRAQAVSPPSPLTPPSPSPVDFPSLFSPDLRSSTRLGLFSSPCFSPAPLPPPTLQQTITTQSQQSMACTRCNGTGRLFFSNSRSLTNPSPEEVENPFANVFDMNWPGL